MIETGTRPNPTVLVVDDEPGVLESLADLLRKEFHVLGTSDPDEALSLLANEEVAVILSDQRMPKQTGAQLLATASALSPDTIRVLLTGYADIEVVIEAVNDAKVFYYLSKPWRNDSILDLVRTAVQKHSLAAEERRLLKKLGGLKSEEALSQMRADLAGESADFRSRDLAAMRSGIATAELAQLHLNQGREKIQLCVSCQRANTPDAGWTNLVEYLRSHTSSLRDVLCPACSAREAAAKAMARDHA